MKKLSAKQRIILHLAVGFVLGGALGNLIALIVSVSSGSGVHVVSQVRAAQLTLPGAVILQTVLAGLLGMAGVGGMLYYDVERWSLLGATAVHYLSVMACFVAVSFALDWLPPQWPFYLISIAAMTAAFATIWLIMYLKWKREVKKMNEDLKKYVEEERQ
ncbi:MAG: DUF3021 domain-containing protein [Clostridia bacterium]|nr:DUF3021 domain-containing protein [Clostridia bacterium]